MSNVHAGDLPGNGSHIPPILEWNIFVYVESQHLMKRTTLKMSSAYRLQQENTNVAVDSLRYF